MLIGLPIRVDVDVPWVWIVDAVAVRIVAESSAFIVVFLSVSHTPIKNVSVLIIYAAVCFKTLGQQSAPLAIPHTRRIRQRVPYLKNNVRYRCRYNSMIFLFVCSYFGVLASLFIIIILNYNFFFYLYKTWTTWC
jgi:hypothetical protein